MCVYIAVECSGPDGNVHRRRVYHMICHMYDSAAV